MLLDRPGAFRASYQTRVAQRRTYTGWSGTLMELGTLLAGKYRVLAKLGEGGMGSVFRAENLVTGKHVALKCMHANVTESRDACERLLREARAASCLSHPNVVDVYDVVPDGEVLFLIMELLHGETLREYLARDSRPKISEFVSLLLPALAGIAAAHERGVIHRDLKPDNIFLAQVPGAPGPVVKVLDFGIAKLAVACGPTLTQTGAALGTPLYMSLEQLRGDKDIDQRADVYALGVILYEAVTGRLPYEAQTLPELAIKVATTDADPVKSLRPDVPTPLARIIDWAVTRDRAQRLPDIWTFFHELEVFARDRSFREQMTQRDAALPRLAAEPAGAAAGAVIAKTTLAATAEFGRAPLVAAVGAGQVRLRAEPDTLRAQERVSSVHPARRRSRWLVAAGAIVGVLLAGGWWLKHQTQAAPQVGAASVATVAAAPPAAKAPSTPVPPAPAPFEPSAAGPSPLPAPDALLVTPVAAAVAHVASPTPAASQSPGGVNTPRSGPPRDLAEPPRRRAVQALGGKRPATRPLASKLKAAPAQAVDTAKPSTAVSLPPTVDKQSSADLVGF